MGKKRRRISFKSERLSMRTGEVDARYDSNRNLKEGIGNYF